MSDRFDASVLDIDYAAEVERICGEMRRVSAEVLRKKGLVLGVSGGIDSSACVALAARALGPERVFALLMPERDSSPQSTELGRLLCDHLGVSFAIEEVGPILEAAGCYRRRDEAIQQVFPEYDTSYKQKIVIPPLDQRQRLTFFSVVIQADIESTPSSTPHLQDSIAEGQR